MEKRKDGESKEARMVRIFTPIMNSINKDLRVSWCSKSYVYGQLCRKLV